jgi:gluconolactonase
VVDPEETALLVAVTRANQIWRVPLHKSGLITKVGIFAHLHGGPGGPDGLALDVEGSLLIAHEGFGSVWRLSPHAEPLDRIVSCAARATMNLAFGGPDNARLFITESQTGSIVQADLSVALADCSFASRSPLAAPRCSGCFLQRNISEAENCQIRNMKITIVT